MRRDRHSRVGEWELRKLPDANRAVRATATPVDIGSVGADPPSGRDALLRCAGGVARVVTILWVSNVSTVGGPRGVDSRPL